MPLLLLLLACQSEPGQNTNNLNNPVDSFESAIPHGKTLPNVELSDEDKIKLAQANGREAFRISPDSLQSIIKMDSVGLVIFNFWSLDCDACYKNILALNELKRTPEEALEFELIHVNTDTLYPEMINSIIRENGIVDPVFTVYNDSIPDWNSMIYSSWDGQLPAILIINNLDGTELFYQRLFSIEELKTIVLPLTF